METPDGAGVRFAHALVREALYEAIPLPSAGGRSHRRAAEALLAAPAPDPDAVADHLQRAGDPRAAEWLIQAGHRAICTFAHQTAAERYASALALTEQAGANPRLQGWCLLYLSQARYLDDASGGIAAHGSGHAPGRCGGRPGAGCLRRVICSVSTSVQLGISGAVSRR